MWQITPIVVALLLATFLNLLVTIVAWRRRKSRLARYFFLSMLGILLWTFSAGMGYALTPLALKIFFATLEAWGYMTALVLLTCAAIQFAGNEQWLRKTSLRLFLGLVWACNVGLVSTNAWHGWMWTDFVPQGNNVTLFVHGPAYPLIALNGYLLIGLITFSLWQAIWKGSALARRQGAVLLLATLFPMLANLAYHAAWGGVKGLDWTSVTYSLTALIYLWAFTSVQLFDLAPIARRHLFENMRDGVIFVDADGRVVDVSAAAARFLRVAQPFFIGKRWLEMLPEAAECALADKEKEAHCEIQLAQAPGQFFDIRLSPIHSEDGAFVGQLLLLGNVTARKENELRLLQLTQAVQQSPITVIITDLEGCILYVNPCFSELTGYTQDEVLGRKTSILQSGRTSQQVYRQMWQTILAGQVWRGEFLNRKKNDELYWEEAVIGPVKDKTGAIVNFIATKQDITLQKQALQDLQTANSLLERQLTEIQTLQVSLREQATHDPLTGLYNRRFLYEVLEPKFAQAERNSQPISILLLDIDHFKRVNDTYGHSAGDACLKTLAQTLEQVSRGSDMCFRYGGEEFLLLLPDTSAAGAFYLAEILRQKVEQTPCLYEDQAIAITISLGVATFPQNGRSSEEIIHCADTALYRSKEQGRNRVSAFEVSAGRGGG